MVHIITDLDLLTNKYTEKELIDNIYSVSLLQVLKTQNLSAEFCYNYLLNSSFQLLPEEELLLTKELILHYQSHISLLDLMELEVAQTNKKSLFDFCNYND